MDLRGVFTLYAGIDDISTMPVDCRRLVKIKATTSMTRAGTRSPFRHMMRLSS